MSIREFGITSNGKKVEAITLRHGTLTATVLTLGGILQSFTKDGRVIVCGFDTVDDYENDVNYLGALIGRYANRIQNGQLTLDDETYSLAKNENGKTHSHGGDVGFDKRIWGCRVFGSEKGEGVKLFLTSPDGEEGYPGKVTVRATYFLDDDGLSIRYEAQTDKKTVINLTNHSYFNADGYDSGSILSHRLRISADSFTAVDADSIPTDARVPVEGTSFDFREEKPVSACTGEEMDQYTYTKGLDHNFNLFECEPILHAGRKLSLAAKITGQVGGLTVYTDFPCLQVYAANYMDGTRPFYGKVTQQPCHAICFEAQTCGANGPARGEGILQPGETLDNMVYFCPETI